MVAGLVLMFPGQGSQVVGMGADLCAAEPLVRQTFNEASAVLGYDLEALCTSGPAQLLARTDLTQPALLTVSVAIHRLLEEEGVRFEVALGHSLGEYSALVAAGAVSFLEAVRLVRRRGEEMLVAAKENPGGMAAVIGLEEPAVVQLCADIDGVWPANFNSPGQTVVSGTPDGLRVAEERAKDLGARRVIPLAVSGAFHSTLMAPAAEFLAEAVTVARRRLARLQVSVDVDTSDVLIGRLLAAKLDFAIARIPEGVDPAPFEFEEIGRESVELLVRRDHPLAALPVVTPADLADREWVLPPRGSLVRRSIEQMMRRHGLPPVDRVLNSGSILMSLVMARRADSIAPLAAPVADLFTGSGDLVRLPLAETPSIEPYGLIRVIGRPMSPAARILYDGVRGREYAVPAGTGATVRTGGTVQASARS